MSRREITFLLHEASRTGAPLATLELAKNLAGQFSLRFIVPGNGPLVASCAALGPVHSLGVGRRFRWYHFPLLLRALANARPQIIHASSIGSYLGVIAGKLTCTPTVLHLHEFPRSVSHLQIAALRMADRVVSVSEALKMFCLDHMGIETELIYNIVDLPAESCTARRTSVQKKVLTVASIHPTKGLHVLIEAAGIVSKTCPDAVFDIVGPCPQGYEEYNASLLQRIEDLQLGGQVRFHGYVEDLTSFYNAASVFAHPSLDESFGLVVAESMAHGIPVIASRVGGLPEVVGGCGTLVPAGDATALASSILEHFAATAAERDSVIDSARERIQSMFTSEQVMPRWVNLYASILDRRPSR